MRSSQICRRVHLRAEREGSWELAYILCCCNLYWCSPLIFTSFLPYYTMTKLKVSTSRNTNISYKFHYDVIHLIHTLLLISLYDTTIIMNLLFLFRIFWYYNCLHIDILLPSMIGSSYPKTSNRQKEKSCKPINEKTSDDLW